MLKRISGDGADPTSSTFIPQNSLTTDSFRKKTTVDSGLRVM